MRAPLALLLLVTVGCGSSGSSGTGGNGQTGGGGGQTGGSGGQTGGGGGTAPDAAAGAGGQVGGQGGAPADASVDRAPAQVDMGPDGTAPAEECRKDSDCPAIQCPNPPCGPIVCVLGESGHHCQFHIPPTPASCPAPNPSFPCCRTSADCTMQPHGQCIRHDYQYCGGPPPLPGNACQYDSCSGDADCTAMPNGFCTAGFPRGCLYGPCRTDADCTRAPGGRCVMATLNSGYCPRPVVFCRYNTDPCRSDPDCRGVSLNGMVCAPRSDLHGTMCVDRGPPPP